MRERKREIKSECVRKKRASMKEGKKAFKVGKEMTKSSSIKHAHNFFFRKKKTQ